MNTIINKAKKYVDPGDWDSYISTKYVENMPQNYTLLSAETRAKLFQNFEDFKNVESAYLGFQSFVNQLQSLSKNHT
jgi:hypothetical protein